MENIGLRKERAADLAVTLVEQGYDEPEMLARMTEDEMKDCGFKPGDLLKIRVNGPSLQEIVTAKVAARKLRRKLSDPEPEPEPSLLDLQAEPEVIRAPTPPVPEPPKPVVRRPIVKKKRAKRVGYERTEDDAAPPTPPPPEPEPEVPLRERH